MTDTQYHAPPHPNNTPDALRRPDYSSPPPGYYASPQSELGNVGRTLLRGWWIIALCGIIAVGVGLGVTSRTHTTYQGTAYVLLNDNDFQSAVTGSSTPVNTQTAEATAVDMLTPQREAQAAQTAGLPAGANYGVNITASSNSNVLHVNGTTSSPRTAAALANAAAAELLTAVKQANATSLSDARAAVQSQLAAAKRSQKQPLASQLNSLTTLQALADHSIVVIQPALVPGAPSGPSKVRNGAIALVLGLVFGVALALLRPAKRRP